MNVGDGTDLYSILRGRQVYHLSSRREDYGIGDSPQEPTYRTTDMITLRVQLPGKPYLNDATLPPSKALILSASSGSPSKWDIVNLFPLILHMTGFKKGHTIMSQNGVPKSCCMRDILVNHKTAISRTTKASRI